MIKILCVSTCPTVQLESDFVSLGYFFSLHWLLFSNCQVSIMQQELKELQPELIETSKETEQLIKIIADETLEVEDKKQVKINYFWTVQQKEQLKLLVMNMSI